MDKYRVVVVRCGGQGQSHAEAFLKNSDRFDLVALSLREARRICHLSIVKNNMITKVLHFFIGWEGKKF